MKNLYYESSSSTVHKKDIMRFLTLDQFISVQSVEHDEETVTQMCRVFCLQSDQQNVKRIGMEFLYMNGFYTELKQLIQRNKVSVNPIDRKWGLIYEVMICIKETGFEPHHLMEDLSKIKTNVPEIKALLIFTKILIDYSTYKFDTIANYLDELKELISEVEDQLLTSLFKTRLNNLLFIYYWKHNELLLARKHAYRAINETYNSERRAYIHINLGLTYIFDTFETSNYHLQEALKIGETYKLNHVIKSIQERNYPFICARFGRVNNVTTSDSSEQAHIEIAKGNMEKAKEILKSIEITPFRKYYMGLATNNEELLLSSYRNFIEERSDHFFARLPWSAINQDKPFSKVSKIQDDYTAL